MHSGKLGMSVNDKLFNVFTWIGRTTISNILWQYKTKCVLSLKLIYVYKLYI